MHHHSAPLSSKDPEEERRSKRYAIDLIELESSEKKNSGYEKKIDRK